MSDQVDQAVVRAGRTGAAAEAVQGRGCPSAVVRKIDLAEMVLCGEGDAEHDVGPEEGEIDQVFRFRYGLGKIGFGDRGVGEMYDRGGIGLRRDFATRPGPAGHESNRLEIAARI